MERASGDAHADVVLADHLKGNRSERREAAIRHQTGSDAIVKPFPVPRAVPRAGWPVGPGSRVIPPGVPREIARTLDRLGGAVILAASAQTVMPVPVSEPACFRGLGCHRR